MDPNRDKLDKIPTRRLLRFFKSERKKLLSITGNMEDYMWSCVCEDCEQYRKNYLDPQQNKVDDIRKELNKREHVPVR